VRRQQSDHKYISPSAEKVLFICADGKKAASANGFCRRRRAAESRRWKRVNAAAARGAQIMINHGALVLDERAIQANRRMFVQSNAHSASAGKRTRLSQQQQQQERRALMCFCLVSPLLGLRILGRSR